MTLARHAKRRLNGHFIWLTESVTKESLIALGYSVEEVGGALRCEAPAIFREIEEPAPEDKRPYYRRFEKRGRK